MLSRAGTGRDRRNGRGSPCYSKEMFYDSLNPDAGLRHLGTAAKGGDCNLKASGCSEVRSWAGGALGLTRTPPPQSDGGAPDEWAEVQDWNDHNDVWWEEGCRRLRQLMEREEGRIS